MSEPHSSPPKPYGDLDRLPIAGRHRHGSSKHRLQDRNPFDDALLLELPQADRHDLDEAYEAAKRAQPDWAAKLPSERAAVIQRAAEILTARRGEVVDWLIAESGSTRMKAELEWGAVRAGMLAAAAAPYQVKGQILPSDVPGKECRVYRNPVGVVGVISPWNWPLQLTNRSLAVALAVGNAVVVKPASDTPVTGGLLLARIFEDAGLPGGLLSVVVGRGEEIGDAFVTHPAPRVISFTGSTPVGRHIGRLAVEASILKRVELELGGNGPFVVLADADLDRAVECAVFGKFLHQGQICMITNRLIVEASVYDEFTARFVERVRALKVGDPRDPDTFVGPVINKKQLDGLTRRIGQARESGERLLLGGEARGLVLPPHVYGEVSPDSPLAREELFGPIAPILRVRDAEEALRVANDTEHGLSSAVFTRDLDRGAEFARRLHAGMAHVNDQPVNDLPNNPFGGEKNSGIGRFGGEWAIDAFTSDQWVTVQRTPRPLPTRAVRGHPSVGG